MPPLLTALLALACAPAAVVLGFTPGNLLVSLAGDGTAAGAPGNATTLVALLLEEFAPSGTTLSSTNETRTVPSPDAVAQGEPPFTTLGNVADPVGSHLAPTSGALTPSDDGFFLTFVGYSCAAGTPVGTSNIGSADVQTNANTWVQVGKNCTRLIAYVDYSGLVRVVDGNLDSISIFTYPASNNFAQNTWSAAYCTSCKGFYVTTGPVYLSTATGGIWFVPSPTISGTLGDGIKLASTPQTLSNRNYDSCVYIRRAASPLFARVHASPLAVCALASPL
jgi:hypothetical protein